MARLHPVVLVSAIFPPSPMAGAPRIRGMLRYLPAHGVVPIAVTTDQGELPLGVDDRIEIFRVEHADPPAYSGQFRGDNLPWWRRLVRDVMATPDRYRLWAARAARLAWRLARERQAPVLVSVPPVSAAWQAARLRKPDDPPLLIDFRDAWIDDPVRADYYRNYLRFVYERRMEALTVRQARACLVTAPGTARAFERRYPDEAGRFRLLLNGFDEADWALLPAVGPLAGDVLHVVYTGSFHGFQTPRHVLQALAELDSPSIALHVIGDGTARAQKLLHEEWPSLAKRVCFHPRADHARALAWQQAADLLLLVLNAGPAADGEGMIIPSKVFEYLRARRPILATLLPGSDLDAMLARFPLVTRLGDDDVPGIKNALLEALRAKRGGALDPPSARQEIEVFRRDRQMGELAHLIAEVARMPRQSRAA